ncbi:MAG: NAD(P)H-quinone oxidoreductase [Pseudomonadota bacterium]|nr:NAD(P)H-quinone oxidoreductase [Pseudomonadota bacterium]
MKAVEISAPGGPEKLVLGSRPVPTPAAGEVLIKVAAAGINRPDVMQRQGSYPPPPGASDIPGLEVAGEVVAVGLGVTAPSIGDSVTALLSGGGYAEYAVAAAPLCLAVPRGMSLIDAAALPETFFTVWTNVFDRGRCKAGDDVLIHGGTSGIGTTAIQLAAALGARVFATAGSDEKARACERLGARRGINYRTEDFVEVVQHETGGKGVDVILDMIGGDYLDRNMKVAAVEGRIVIIATMGGTRAELKLTPLMMKRLTITGSTLRSRTVDQKAAVATAVRETVWPLVESGRIRPIIHGKFPLANAAAAHRLMESSDHIGKIVLVT